MLTLQIVAATGGIAVYLYGVVSSVQHFRRWGLIETIQDGPRGQVMRGSYVTTGVACLCWPIIAAGCLVQSILDR